MTRIYENNHSDATDAMYSFLILNWKSKQWELFKTRVYIESKCNAGKCNESKFYSIRERNESAKSI